MTRESFPAIPRLSVGAAALAVGGNMHAVTTVPRVAEYPRPVARQIDKDGFAVGAAQVSAGAAPRPGSGQREPSPSPRPGGWPGDRARTHDRAAQALDRHHAQAADVVTPWVKRRTSAMSSFGKFHPDPVRAGAGPESTQRSGGAGRCQRGRCAASHQLTQQRVQLVDVRVLLWDRLTRRSSSIARESAAVSGWT